MANFWRHHLNSMHVYCRLCAFMPRGMAKNICRLYEKIVHPILYGK